MLEASLILRTIILLLALSGTVHLLANLLQNYDTLNPSYKAHFFKQQCLRPCLHLICALLLFWMEGPLTRWMGA